jgi:hypothetical protein
VIENNMKEIKINIPKNWRRGQFLFNFLEFCKTKGVSGNQNVRLADTFHLSDDEFEGLLKEFTDLYGS